MNICKLSFLILLFCLLVSSYAVAANSADKDKAFDKESKEFCESLLRAGSCYGEELKIDQKDIGMITIPRPIVVNACNGDNVLEETPLTDIFSLYQKDIRSRLKEMEKPGRRDALLDCTLKLIQSNEKALQGNYSANLSFVSQSEGPETAITIKLYEAQYKAYSKPICEDYNEIALQFERNNDKAKAGDIYRHVLRNFEGQSACSSEAKIMLEGIVLKSSQP